DGETGRRPPQFLLSRLTDGVGVARLRAVNASNVRTVGVVGAGQMGRGIAQVAAAAGYDVGLCDTTKAIADSGKARIADGLARQVDKGKLTADGRDKLLARIAASGDLGDLGRTDISIEAVSENVDIKIAIFREIDRLLPRASHLASNTSSISITRLAA